MSYIVYIFQCGRCHTSYYDETDKDLKVGSGKHIGISPLTFKKINPSVESSICYHHLLCNHDPSFDDFTILDEETNKFLLENKRALINQA